MELKEFISLLKKNLVLLVILGAIGAALGATVIVYLPIKWTSSQTYIIEKRSIKDNGAYFNYDGYYANQVGISYTNNLASLFESRDIKIKTLETLQTELIEKNIVDLNKNLKVKKLGPQVLQVTYQNFNKEKAENVLNASTENALKSLTASNWDSGLDITITKINSSTSAVQNYINPYLTVSGATAITTLATILVLIVRDYLNK